MIELNFWRSYFLPALFGAKLFSFRELTFRAGFSTVPGRAVEREEKGWQTADAAHLCSLYPVELGEADPQSLPMSFLFGHCREIVDALNAMDGLVVHVVQHLGGGMQLSS